MIGFTSPALGFMPCGTLALFVYRIMHAVVPFVSLKVLL